jgi:hypothetical protein
MKDKRFEEKSQRHNAEAVITGAVNAALNCAAEFRCFIAAQCETYFERRACSSCPLAVYLEGIIKAALTEAGLRINFQIIVSRRGVTINLVPGQFVGNRLFFKLPEWATKFIDLVDRPEDRPDQVSGHELLLTAGLPENCDHDGQLRGNPFVDDFRIHPERSTGETWLRMF